MTLAPRTRLTLETLDDRLVPSAAGHTVFGAAPGGLPLVEVRRPDGSPLVRFQGLHPGMTGGVQTAIGELDGDLKTLEVVVGAGPGFRPWVGVHSVDLATGSVTPLTYFLAYSEDFRGGVRVAVGDVLGSGEVDQIIVGADVSGGSHVRVLWLNGGAVLQDSGPLGSFFAFEPEFRGGVRVAAGRFSDDPNSPKVLVVAPGAGGGPRIKGLAPDGSVVTDFYALSPNFTGGLAVGFQDDDRGRGLFFATPTDEDPSQSDDELNEAAGISRGRGFGLPEEAFPIFVTPTQPVRPQSPFPTFVSDPSTGIAFGASGLIVSTNGVVFGDARLVESLGLNATALIPSNTPTNAAVAVSSGAAVQNPLSLGAQTLNLILGNGGVAPAQSIIVGTGARSDRSDEMAIVPNGAAVNRGSSLSRTILNQAIAAALSNFDI